MRKQILVFAMMAVLLLNPVMTVCAEDDNQTTNTSGTQTATVTYEQDSTYTVTIPRTLVFDSNKTVNYTVTVLGDMKAGEYITVTPASTVTMTDEKGKDDVIGTITQAKTSFTYDEIGAKDGEGNLVGTSTTGTITASDLSAGVWSGTFNFTIAVVSN